MHKAGIDNQDKILCTKINGRFFFGNFWQGQDGLLIFWPVFCLLAIWSPQCPASSGRLSLSSSKVHGSLPMASWAQKLFDSPENLKNSYCWKLCQP